MENDESREIEEPTFESWREGICEQLENLHSVEEEQARGYRTARVTNRILERFESSADAVESAACVGLLQSMLGQSAETALINALILKSGLSLYEGGNFPLAERLFRLGSDYGDRDAQNNLAYMIRRGEVANPTEHFVAEALHLLRNGMRDKEAFALVNSALALSLCLGAEDDWRLADRLMSFIPSDRALSVAKWWEQVGKSGDHEGALVHLWLLRHRMMALSVFGTQESIYKRLVQSLPTLPNWMRDLA